MNCRKQQLNSLVLCIVNVCVKKSLFIVLYSIFVFNSGFMLDSHGRYTRDDSSASDDGGDSQSTVFMIGGGEYLTQTPVVTTQIQTSNNVVTVTSVPLMNNSVASSQSNNNIAAAAAATAAAANTNNFSNLTSAHSVSTLPTPPISGERLVLPRSTQPITIWPIILSFKNMIRSLSAAK